MSTPRRTDDGRTDPRDPNEPRYDPTPGQPTQPVPPVPVRSQTPAQPATLSKNDIDTADLVHLRVMLQNAHPSQVAEINAKIVEREAQDRAQDRPPRPR